MNIFLTGQVTLHWGRMEFGNIGNYYIIEPFIRELYRVFPEGKIKTTFQMSEEFCVREKVELLPMDLYYGWNENDLDLALTELASAEIFSKSGVLPKTTPYIDEVLNSDLVIDFSGDIWGDNADLLGDNRFLIGLCKNRVAQLLEKPTVMLAGSPGPFKNQNVKEFAKEVFSNFDLVTNRESISIELLREEGFDVQNTKSLSCPAFLFEPIKDLDFEKVLNDEGIPNDGRPNVGFILCGWNFLEGPFDKKNRSDSEYTIFAEAVEYISNELNANVILMSHSNGFPIPPKKFKLIHGRDYDIIKQLETVINKRGFAENVYTLDGVYDTWTTKAIIGNLDMLVSGRVHGAVAGLSQHIPTVMIDYGHEPKAHKVRGFALEVRAIDYLANPSLKSDLISKIKLCWANYEEYKTELEKIMIEVKQKAKQNFDVLKTIV